MFNAKAKRREARNQAMLRLATAIILDHRRVGRSRYLLTSAHLGVPIAQLCTDLQAAFVSIGEPVQLVSPIQSGSGTERSTVPHSAPATSGDGQPGVCLLPLDVLSPAYNLRAIFDQIDGAIVVVGAGLTHRRDLLDVLELLRRSDVPIVGTVLNDRRQVIPGFISKRL